MLLASANQCSRILRLFLFSFGSAFCGHHKRLPVNGGANQHPECFWLRPISAHEPSAFAVYSGLALGNVLEASAAAAKSFQSCPTLCDPLEDRDFRITRQKHPLRAAQAGMGPCLCQGRRPSRTSGENVWESGHKAWMPTESCLSPAPASE